MLKPYSSVGMTTLTLARDSLSVAISGAQLFIVVVVWTKLNSIVRLKSSLFYIFVVFSSMSLYISIVFFSEDTCHYEISMFLIKLYAGILFKDITLHYYSIFQCFLSFCFRGFQFFIFVHSQSVASTPLISVVFVKRLKV